MSSKALETILNRIAMLFCIAVFIVASTVFIGTLIVIFAPDQNDRDPHAPRTTSKTPDN